MLLDIDDLLAEDAALNQAEAGEVALCDDPARERQKRKRAGPAPMVNAPRTPSCCYGLRDHIYLYLINLVSSFVFLVFVKNILLRKTLLQRVRRSSSRTELAETVTDETQSQALSVRTASYNSLDGVIVLKEEQKLDGHGHALTFQTCMRIAICSAKIGPSLLLGN